MKTGPVLVWELLDDLVSYYEQDAGKKLAEGRHERVTLNDRKFREHLLRLERERKEAQAANAAVKKPPTTAKSQRVKKTHSA